MRLINPGTGQPALNIMGRPTGGRRRAYRRETFRAQVQRRNEPVRLAGGMDRVVESIAKRFLTFRNQSYPVVEKYEVLGKVKRVDSSVGTPDEVFAKVAPLFSVTTGK